MRRFLAIAMIWLGCAAAWLLLGSTLMVRSGDTSSSLRGEVHELWGEPIEQLPPEGRLFTPDAPSPTQPGAPNLDVPKARLAATHLDVSLDLEHRRKGLVWFPTYIVDFAANYTFVNSAGKPRRLEVRLPLAAEGAVYEGFEVLRENGQSLPVDVELGSAVFSDKLAAGERKNYQVRFRSRGTSRWLYRPTAGTGRVDDFVLKVHTDFQEVDFPEGTLSPTSHEQTEEGWTGHWRFKSLVANAPVGLELPQRLNPGPLAAKITFFAPVALLFFFFVVAILAAAKNERLHPLHYLFLGMAFFAFHLLFAYLVDHLSVASSFAIASLTSVALVISYARLFVGWRFALVEIGVSQLLYLVLFSFTFFWSGFTGLSVTIGAIATLFVLMQITGRKSWAQLLGEPELVPASAVCATPYRCAKAGGPDARPVLG